MKAHAARGERGLAVQAYDRCRAVLADMLDAAPSVETQKLLNEIRGPSHSRLPLRPPQPVAALLPLADAAVVAAPSPEAPADEMLPTSGKRENSVTRGGAHIGVMPFRLVGMPDEDAHLAPGLADEITNALSRFRWMFIVSANSLGRFAADSRRFPHLSSTTLEDFLMKRMTLSAAITLLINVILVATMSDRGANALSGAVVNLFSGMVVPLAFFPDAVRPWLRAQPFAGLADIPFSIYFGAITGWSAIGGIALQFGWAAVLAVLGRRWLGSVMTRLQVQGG
jgi:TolB-like protein